MEHRKLGFSTYGSRLDVQNWGGNVMTAGYGVCDFGPGSQIPERHYTPRYSGTSSASALYAQASAVACDLQIEFSDRLLVTIGPPVPSLPSSRMLRISSGSG